MPDRVGILFKYCADNPSVHDLDAIYFFLAVSAAGAALSFAWIFCALSR